MPSMGVDVDVDVDVVVVVLVGVEVSRKPEREGYIYDFSVSLYQVERNSPGQREPRRSVFVFLVNIGFGILGL